MVVIDGQPISGASPDASSDQQPHPSADRKMSSFLRRNLDSILDFGPPEGLDNRPSHQPTDFLDPETLAPMAVDPLRPPKLSDGYYQTATLDNAVIFSYFYVIMSEPQVSKLLSWDAVYPVILLTNIQKVKRSCAVCKRTYGEYRQLYGLVHSFLKRSRFEDTTVFKIPALYPIPSVFVETRKRAIELFVNELVADHRVFNIPLFHAFFYTDMSAEDLFTNDLGTNKKLVISADLQDYEKDILPAMLSQREIMDMARNNAKTVIETVGYDVVNRRVEIPEDIWQDSPEDEAAGALLFPATTNGDLPSCSKPSQPEMMASDDQGGTTIPIVHRADDSCSGVHQGSVVASSFIDYGNEERVHESPDGNIVAYPVPNPVVVGSCPDRDKSRLMQSRKASSKQKRPFRTSSTMAVIHTDGSRENDRVARSLPGGRHNLSSSRSTPKFTFGSEQSPDDELPVQTDVIAEEEEDRSTSSERRHAGENMFSTDEIV